MHSTARFFPIRAVASSASCRGSSVCDPMVSGRGAGWGWFRHGSGQKLLFSARFHPGEANSLTTLQVFGSRSRRPKEESLVTENLLAEWGEMGTIVRRSKRHFPARRNPWARGIVMDTAGRSPCCSRQDMSDIMGIY